MFVFIARHIIHVSQLTKSELHKASHYFDEENGLIRTSRKFVHLDKISVLTNVLQVRMVCRDLKKFGRSGKIKTSNVPPTGQKLDKIV